MSPDELTDYGSVLIDHPHACAFTMWTAKYDYRDSYAHLEYVYFERPEIKAAMEAISLKDLIIKAVEAYLEKKGGK